MYLSAVREAMDALDLLHNTLKKIRFVVGWLGSIHGVYCCDVPLLPAASYCFLLLPVASCCFLLLPASPARVPTL